MREFVEFGRVGTLQDRNTLLMTYAGRPGTHYAKFVKDKVQRASAAMFLFRWTDGTDGLFVNREPVRSLPRKLAPGDWWFIEDGDVYAAVRPLEATRLRGGKTMLEKRTRHVVLYQDNVAAENITGIADADWIKARSGFVVEMGDKAEFGSFAAFQDKILAGKVTADEADGFTRHIAYERDDRRLDMRWHAYTEEYATRKINGRDDPWTQFAQSPEFAVSDSGQLAVKDATLATTPGKTAWLLSCEPSHTWVAYQPNADACAPPDARLSRRPRNLRAFPPRQTRHRHSTRRQPPSRRRCRKRRADGQHESHQSRSPHQRPTCTSHPCRERPMDHSRQVITMKHILTLLTALLLAPLAAPMIGSFTVASAVEPFCTETCGPTRALGVLKPGKPVPLDEGFRDPPSICRVQCWWQCHGSAFTKEEITRQLEEFKAQGFGGVTVKDTTNMPRDKNTQHIADIDYVSPRWLDMFAHIVKECERLGLICRTRLGSGWNAGGPWVKPHMASQVMAFAPLKPITGPTTFSGTIPTAADGSPTLAALRNETAYVLAIRQGDQRPVDLTEKVTDQRKLTWDVPEGTWTLVSFYSKPDASRVGSCSTSGAGLHHDHCSEAGTDLMIANVADPILAKLGSFQQSAFDGFNLDSWELGNPTWTPRFRREFTERRGYDPVPYLPVLMQVRGLVEEGFRDYRSAEDRMSLAFGEKERRFLLDLRTTVSELVVETHYARIRRWCQQHGVVLEAQAGGPHTIPNEPLQSQGSVDVPMGEFWSGSWTFVRPTASAAHTYGRRLVSLESFTGEPGFRVRPGEMKPRVDEAFLLGGNYLNIAVTDYSPKEAGRPGWIACGRPASEPLPNMVAHVAAVFRLPCPLLLPAAIGPPRGAGRLLPAAPHSDRAVAAAQQSRRPFQRPQAVRLRSDQR